MNPRAHAPEDFQGRVEIRTFESTLLKHNRLGDRATREVPVYLPPGWDRGEWPVLFCLAGFTGRGQSMLETHPWRRGLVWHFDQAVARGESPGAILVLPDCFTRLGGSQYVNSATVGPYGDHVARELTAFVDEHYPTRTNGRGVIGKSSGGFGALHLCMHYPGTFDACASISGDAGFEAMFAGELLACLRGLVSYDMDPGRFLEAFAENPDLSGDGHAVINVLAMSACYSPNPASPLGFDLPMDLETGQRREDVWNRWLAFDPVQAVERHAEPLRALRLLHLECGLRDEFHIQWGVRSLSRRLYELSVPHTHEEHGRGHRGLDDRYGPLLARMAAALDSEPQG